jgi:alpha,alpha-trehalose phosphorylase
VYTNLMAQRNLNAAADAAERYPDRACQLGLSWQEIHGWPAAVRPMLVPYDEKLAVHPQAEGFTRHEIWDFAGTSPEWYPLMLHLAYFDLYRKQVVKQADPVLAMQLRPDTFTPEQKERNFAYHERITVRDSSVSACRSRRHPTGPAARARTRPPDAAGTVKARSRQREPSCSRRERSRNS